MRVVALIPIRNAVAPSTTSRSASTSSMAGPDGLDIEIVEGHAG
jgi:hypothetical protein